MSRKLLWFSFCFVLFLMCSVIESATSVLCFAIMQAVRVT